MSVKLISWSQPSLALKQEGIDSAQDLIAYCARVSNPGNQFNNETSEKLIKYLVKHKHWSPLEMASATLEIETTRDIARQILRHRSFSFQEFSQRYANPADMGDMFQYREARLQDEKNRQNSIDVNDAELEKAWTMKQQMIMHEAKIAYNWAIENGIAKEQARAVLPEGLTKSRLYMNGTLRSWVHFIELRSANGTQKEHMQIARECSQVISRILPLIETFLEE